jgi:hypothetical protein
MQQESITTYIKRYVGNIKVINFAAMGDHHDVKFQCADGVYLYFSKHVLGIRNIDYFNSIIFNDFKDNNEPVTIEYDSDPFNLVLNCIYYNLLLLSDDKNLNIACFKILHYIHYLVDDVTNEINDIMKNVINMTKEHAIDMFDVSILYYNMLSSRVQINLLYVWTKYDVSIPVTKDIMVMIKDINIKNIEYCKCTIFAVVAKIIELFSKHKILLSAVDFDVMINLLLSINDDRIYYCKHYNDIMNSYKSIIYNIIIMNNSHDPIIKKFIDAINEIYMFKD